MNFKNIIPAKRFTKNSYIEQMGHVKSENREELEAFYKYNSKEDPILKKELALELIDGQLTRETTLYCLGYTEAEILQLREEKIAKNAERGYYAEPKTKGCRTCKHRTRNSDLYRHQDCYHQVGVCFNHEKYEGEELELVEENVTENQPFDLPEIEKAAEKLKEVDFSAPTAAKGFFLTRRELAEFINNEVEEVKRVFSYKNEDYGADGDGFANFRKTAVRIVIPFMEKHGVPVTEREAMFLVAQILQDKHLCALAQTGIDGNEVAERLTDVANYSLIMKAMLSNE